MPLTSLYRGLCARLSIDDSRVTLDSMSEASNSLEDSHGCHRLMQDMAFATSGNICNMMFALETRSMSRSRSRSRSGDAGEAGAKPFNWPKIFLQAAGLSHTEWRERLSDPLVPWAS